MSYEVCLATLEEAEKSGWAITQPSTMHRLEELAHEFCHVLLAGQAVTSQTCLTEHEVHQLAIQRGPICADDEEILAAATVSLMMEEVTGGQAYPERWEDYCSSLMCENLRGDVRNALERYNTHRKDVPPLLGRLRTALIDYGALVEVD